MLTYMFICAPPPALLVRAGLEEDLQPPELGLQRLGAIVWVLGLKPGSSARTPTALDWRVTSPAPFLLLANVARMVNVWVSLALFSGWAMSRLQRHRWLWFLRLQGFPTMLRFCECVHFNLMLFSLEIPYYKIIIHKYFSSNNMGNHP